MPVTNHNEGETMSNAMTNEQLRNLSANAQYQRTINTVTTSGEDAGALIVHGLAYDITDPSQDRSQVWVTHVTPIVDGKCEVDCDLNMTADEAEELARQLVQSAFLARLHNQLHRDELRAEAAASADLTAADKCEAV